jgi:hypothetical protein
MLAQLSTYLTRFLNGKEPGSPMATKGEQILLGDRLNQLAALGSAETGEGAALIATEDAGSLYTAENVEEALAEARTKLSARKAATTLTIASGVITVTQSQHRIDTQSAAASDDVDTINGFASGDLVFLRSVASARNVVFKHGTGNLNCPGGVDLTLDLLTDCVLGFYDSNNAVWDLFPVTFGLAAYLPSSLAAIDADGIQAKRIARATFDPSANAGERTIGAHTLGVTIPDKAIITRVWYQVKTTFTSAGADAGTIAISAEGANDIVSAVAISDGGNPWDAGYHEAIQTGAASAFIGTTAARLLTATVAGQALTAGKLVLFVEYVVGY